MKKSIIVLLLLIATWAYGAEYPEIRQPYTENNLTVRRDIIEDCDKTIDECNHLVKTLLERIEDCSNKRKADLEEFKKIIDAYYKALLDNGIAPPKIERK